MDSYYEIEGYKYASISTIKQFLDDIINDVFTFDGVYSIEEKTTIYYYPFPDEIKTMIISLKNKCDTVYILSSFLTRKFYDDVYNTFRDLEHFFRLTKYTGFYKKQKDAPQNLANCSINIEFELKIGLFPEEFKNRVDDVLSTYQRDVYYGTSEFYTDLKNGYDFFGEPVY